MSWSRLVGLQMIMLVKNQVPSLHNLHTKPFTPSKVKQLAASIHVPFASTLSFGSRQAKALSITAQFLYHTCRTASMSQASRRLARSELKFACLEDHTTAADGTPAWHGMNAAFHRNAHHLHARITIILIWNNRFFQTCAGWSSACSCITHAQSY